MYVDAVTTAAVADELNTKVVGGRVQDVVEVDDQTIGLEIYANHQRHYLLMTIDPQGARVQLVPDKLRRGVERPSPLGQLLNKYVDGARLMAVDQPPWERILTFDFSGDEGETRLIAETMDKRSNLVLTVEGDILDSLKRVGKDQNRYRVTLPGRTYVPPPPIEKTLPERVTLGLMTDFFKGQDDTPAWRVLVNNIAGVSPLFAREVIYFASGDATAPAFDVAPSMIHAAFKKRIDDVLDHDWTPCVVPVAEAGYVAFAAYALTHLDGWTQVDSISAAMTAYYGAPVGMEAYKVAKEPVMEQIDGAIDRLRGKLFSLEQQSADDAKIETLRKKGELILAYGATLTPKQTVFRAQYDPDEPEMEIELEPRLSYSENAKAYFEKYEKAKRAGRQVPRRIALTRHEIRYLQQLKTDLHMAESWPEITEIREQLQDEGYWQGSRTAAPRGGRPGIRRFTEDGYVILVGRNARQNHELITERAGGHDLWLHARRIPGSHVIVKNDGRPIPEKIIQRAAELAAYYSAGRHDTSVEVDVTERRYVRPIKGGKPGMVTYKNEETLTVRPKK